MEIGGEFSCAVNKCTVVKSRMDIKLFGREDGTGTRRKGAGWSTFLAEAKLRSVQVNSNNLKEQAEAPLGQRGE